MENLAQRLLNGKFRRELARLVPEVRKLERYKGFTELKITDWEPLSTPSRVYYESKATPGNYKEWTEMVADLAKVIPNDRSDPIWDLFIDCYEDYKTLRMQLPKHGLIVYLKIFNPIRLSSEKKN